MRVTASRRLLPPLGITSFITRCRRMSCDLIASSSFAQVWAIAGSSAIAWNPTSTGHTLSRNHGQIHFQLA
jgi:hypothetical protein